MGQITSNIGLITGIPITDTVNQLMQIAARSRDLIVARNKAVQSEGDAVAQLTASTLGVQLAAKRLANPSIFTAKNATSSNAAVLAATATGNPAVGEYHSSTSFGPDSALA